MAKTYFRHVHALWLCWYSHRLRGKGSDEIELSARAASNGTLGASIIFPPFVLLILIFPLELPSRGVFLLAALVMILLVDRRLERYFQRVKDDVIAEAGSIASDPDKGARWALRRAATITLTPFFLSLSAIVIVI